MNTPKTRYIIPAAVLVTAITLSGCTLFKPKPTIEQNQANRNRETSDNDNSGSGSFNINNGQGNFSVTSEEGDAAVQFGGKLPDSWPKDLPVPQNGQLVFAGSEVEGEVTTFTASFAVQDGIEAVANELKAAYERAGWTIEDVAQGTFGVMIASFEGKKDGNEVNVAILGGEDTETQQEGVSVTISGEYK